MFLFFNKQKYLNNRLLKAAEKGDLKKIKKYVEKGADVNCFKDDFNPPLLLVACEDNAEAVRYLLSKGAVVDIRNGRGCTPLMAAAEQGLVDVMKVLLEAGADVSLLDRHNLKAEDFSRRAAKWDAEKFLKQFKKFRQFIEPKPNHSPDEIILQRPLANRILQEVFNFVTFERTSIVRKDPNSDVEAIVRESFSSLGDKTSLRTAFEEHVRRGGKVDESVVFPGTLSKPRSAPPSEPTPQYPRVPSSFAPEPDQPQPPPGI